MSVSRQGIKNVLVQDKNIPYCLHESISMMKMNAIPLKKILH